MTFPIEKVRAQFPALALTDEGRARAYLDNPAGTQVPQVVVDAISHAIVHSNANLGGFFPTTLAAEQVVVEAHKAMADFLGGSEEEIIIGANMTSLTYHMSRTLGRTFAAGDEIIVTRMDHEGDVSPWLQMAEDRGLTVRWLPFNEETWQIEEEALRALLNDRTRLIALNYASNLTGSINQVQKLVAIAKETGVLTYVDAVQFAPHGLVNVWELGCDFLACSSYKFFGPHLGILWGRKELLENLEAYKCRCSTSQLPEKFETGTPQIELLAGLTAVVNYFDWLGRELGETGSRRAAIGKAFEGAITYETHLMGRLISGLKAIPGVTIHGITNDNRFSDRVPTISFTHASKQPEEIARALAAKNVFVWSGHNYAYEVVKQLGIDEETGVVRIGAAHYNTTEEMEACIEAVATAL
jgi:cysteine desulfurase family protein (TIGR01976 family)